MIECLQTGWTINAVAAAVGTDGRTVRKWRDRFRAEGIDGLTDQSHGVVEVRGRDQAIRPQRARRSGKTIQFSNFFAWSSKRSGPASNNRTVGGACRWR